ncbi:hypothetical protein [Pseudomonas sp. KB-10]|uniref:hypothetical protein n=1 Tax=Pseudomonas sp. KB-10 TaxID=2292264 RepID=UPI001BAE82AB|nr:hypothetical protein [Pseudomonas sp. KB-10]
MISLKRYEQCVAIANDESRDLRVRVIALRMATRAKTAALHRALLNHPHILKQAFAPGAPFYGVPSYTMQPDGSMKRNAPALVVHSSDGGQRIVERSGRKP